MAMLTTITSYKHSTLQNLLSSDVLCVIEGLNGPAPTDV